MIFEGSFLVIIVKMSDKFKWVMMLNFVLIFVYELVNDLVIVFCGYFVGVVIFMMMGVVGFEGLMVFFLVLVLVVLVVVLVLLGNGLMILVILMEEFCVIVYMFDVDCVDFVDDFVVLGVDYFVGIEWVLSVEGVFWLEMQGFILYGFVQLMIDIGLVIFIVVMIDWIEVGNCYVLGLVRMVWEWYEIFC